MVEAPSGSTIAARTRGRVRERDGGYAVCADPEVRSQARGMPEVDARPGSRGGSRVAPGVSRMPPSRRCQPGLVHEPLLGGDAGPRRRSRAPGAM